MREPIGSGGPERPAAAAAAETRPGGGPAGRAGRADRRASPRLDLPRPVRAICGGPDVAAVVVECAPDGIGLLADAPIDAGRSFAIRTAGAISVLAYEVVHCRPTDDGRFRIGARLVTSNVANPTADDLLAALASL